MRIKVLLIGITLAAILASCVKPHAKMKEQWEVIDSICEKSPREALKIIDSIGEHSPRMAEYDLRKWQLLRTKARFRSDIPLTTDDTMKEVVAFFCQNGTTEEQIEAYYYLACTYFDMHDSPQCVISGRKSIDLSISANHPLPAVTAKACAMLSHVFRRQHNPQEALRYAQIEYDLARKYKLSNPAFIVDMATSYFRLNDTLQTIHYYRETLEDIKKQHSEQAYAGIICEMLNYYPYMGLREEAEECYSIIESLPDEIRPHNYYCAKARYFNIFGPADSAIVYHLHELEDPTDFYGRREAARSLMDICAQEGKYAEATRYAHIYAEACDSIRELLKLEQTRDANNEYQYRRSIEREAEVLRQAEKANRQRNVAIGLGILTSLFAIIGFLVYKWQTTRRMLEQERMISEEREQNDNLRKMMLRAQANSGSTETLARFEQVAKGTREESITDRDWQQLCVLLNQHYPHFIDNVYKRKPNIKAKDLYTLCLMKMGMTKKGMVNVTGLSRSTLYEKCKMLDIQFGDLIGKN